MTTRVFYSMKCILFVLLLTSGSFSLLTKGQISVDLLKDREFINILDKGNTLLKKKTKQVERSTCFANKLRGKNWKEIFAFSELFFTY